MNFIDYLPITITCSSIVAQIVLTFVFWFNYYEIYALVILGYIFWGFTVIFGVLPIFAFRKKGGVPKKTSYMHTSKLVDTGLYAIVRHPQFLAGILWSIALVFISQHWVVDVLLIPVVLSTYIDTFKADRDLIEKFGDEYVEYMKRVPSLNALWGIILLIFRKKKKNEKKEDAIE